MIAFMSVHVEPFCIKDEDFITNYLKNGGELKEAKKIGSGSFGDVYRILWEGIKGGEKEQEAVVKITKQKDYNASLEKEARIMNKAYNGDGINHIPKCHGCFIGNDETYYLVFQYIPTKIYPNHSNKEDPKNKYIDFATLPVLGRFEIYAQMAEGLHQLHLKGITHGDFKPGNLLIDDTEDPWKVYIIDFGGAAETNERCQHFTPTYLDECFVNHYNKHHKTEKKTGIMEPYDCGPDLDVYSLAITIYVLENSYDSKNKKIVQPGPEFVYGIKGYVEEIQNICSLVQDPTWVKQKEISYATSTNCEFGCLIQKMTDKEPGKRPRAIEIANMMRQMKTFVPQNENVVCQLLNCLKINMGMI